MKMRVRDVPMKRTSETVKGGSEGEEGVGEGGTDELAGVGGDVSTFVVTR